MGVFLIAENEIGVFTEIVSFDVAPAETHNQTAIPTEFPVEDGSTVSDHIHIQAPEVSVEVFVSNAPTRPNFLNLRGRYEPRKLNIPTPFQPLKLFTGASIATPGAGTRTALSAIGGRLTPPIKMATVLVFDPFDAVSETHLKLKSLFEGKQKIRLVTSLTEYKDMYITSVSNPRNVADGTGARFQLTFKRIRKVTAAVVAAPEIPLLPSGKPTKNRGGVGAKAVDDEEARKANRSLLLKAAQSVLGNF